MRVCRNRFAGQKLPARAGSAQRTPESGSLRIGLFPGDTLALPPLSRQMPVVSVHPAQTGVRETAPARLVLTVQR